MGKLQMRILENVEKKINLLIQNVNNQKFIKEKLKTFLNLKSY